MFELQKFRLKINNNKKDIFEKSSPFCLIMFLNDKIINGPRHLVNYIQYRIGFIWMVIIGISNIILFWFEPRFFLNNGAHFKWRSHFRNSLITVIFVHLSHCHNKFVVGLPCSCAQPCVSLIKVLLCTIFTAKFAIYFRRLSYIMTNDNLMIIIS